MVPVAAILSSHRQPCLQFYRWMFAVRYNYEYERNGTASIFMFCEPLAGRRTVSVKEQRTMIDWAHQVKHLLDVEYPDALSCDSGVGQP